MNWYFNSCHWLVQHHFALWWMLSWILFVVWREKREIAAIALPESIERKRLLELLDRL